MSIYIGGKNITGGFTTEEKKYFNNSINSINEQLDNIAKSLDDFPVVGDGISDDTDIIQTAINYCSNNKIN